MAKYVIFKTEVPHLKKEGKMERREKWQLWQKRQPVAQAVANLEKRVTTMKNHNFN